MSFAINCNELLLRFLIPCRTTFVGKSCFLYFLINIVCFKKNINQKIGATSAVPLELNEVNTKMLKRGRITKYKKITFKEFSFRKVFLQTLEASLKIKILHNTEHSYFKNTHLTWVFKKTFWNFKSSQKMESFGLQERKTWKFLIVFHNIQ